MVRTILTTSSALKLLGSRKRSAHKPSLLNTRRSIVFAAVSVSSFSGTVLLGAVDFCSAFSFLGAAFAFFFHSCKEKTEQPIFLATLSWVCPSLNMRSAFALSASEKPLRGILFGGLDGCGNNESVGYRNEYAT